MEAQRDLDQLPWNQGLRWDFWKGVGTQARQGEEATHRCSFGLPSWQPTPASQHGNKASVVPGPIKPSWLAPPWDKPSPCSPTPKSQANIFGQSHGFVCSLPLCLRMAFTAVWNISKTYIWCRKNILWSKIWLLFISKNMYILGKKKNVRVTGRQDLGPKSLKITASTSLGT